MCTPRPGNDSAVIAQYKYQMDGICRTYIHHGCVIMTCMYRDANVSSMPQRNFAYCSSTFINWKLCGLVIADTLTAASVWFCGNVSWGTLCKVCGGRNDGEEWRRMMLLISSCLQRCHICNAHLLCHGNCNNQYRVGRICLYWYNCIRVMHLGAVQLLCTHSFHLFGCSFHCFMIDPGPSHLLLRPMVAYLPTIYARAAIQERLLLSMSLIDLLRQSYACWLISLILDQNVRHWLWILNFDASFGGISI